MTNKKHKILITGATGFIGSFLVEKLNREGHITYSLVRNPKKLESQPLPGKILYGNLSSSIESWVSLLPKDLDTVIHLAGIVHSFNDKEYFDVNVDGTKKIINYLKKSHPKLRFIFISSQAAMGPAKSGIPMTETDSTWPVSQYGRSKLLAEKYLKDNGGANWEKVIIRPPLVIGPRDQGFLDVFKMVKSRIIPIAGKKKVEKLYSFVGVMDLVELISKTILKDHFQNSPEIFIPAHQDNISYDFLISEVRNCMGIKKVFKISVPIFFLKIMAQIFKIMNKFFGFDFRLTPDKINELIPCNWSADSSKSINQLEMIYKGDLRNVLKLAFDDYREKGLI